jgi:hypothetical protein
MQSRHVSVFIARSADDVYAYAADPANLPAWAHGLAGGIELVDGRWFGDSPMGRVCIEFARPNEFGVLDHFVEVSPGKVFYNPMRVLPDENGCEVVFTVRRHAPATEAEFRADIAAVAADLESLRLILEG